MKVIPRETKRVTYSTEIRELKAVPFTKVQRAVVIGSILGDGSLLPNWSKTNYRLSINHCVEQKAYLLWKSGILKNYILSEPRFYERNNSLTIRTISHRELTELRKLFYSHREKIVPKGIREFLKDPFILAIWFMDDGNAVMRKGKLCGYHLNSQSFSFRENLFLSDSIKTLYGIDSVLEKNHGKYRLAIWKSESRMRLRTLLQPLVIPSMSYKLG